MWWVICGMKTVEITCKMVAKIWNANCGTEKRANVTYSTVVSEHVLLVCISFVSP